MRKNSFYGVLSTIFIMVLFSSIGQAAEPEKVEFPKLPQQSEKLADFVPDCWIIEFFRQDDLNNDGQLDTVMVLKDTDDANFIRQPDCETCERVDCNPRMLVVLFGEGKTWKLIKQNTTFIPRVTATQSADPFNGVVYGGVYLKAGTLDIRIGWFGSSLGYNNYTFRWQNNDFYLIGNDTYERQRTSGVETTRSYNFLTWREKIITETPVEDTNSDKVVQKTVWKTLKRQPLLKLDELYGADVGYDINDK